MLIRRCARTVAVLVIRSTTIRKHLRSNVIGYAALFVALSGTAMASHPGGADTISAGDIINNEIRTEDIRDANVTTADIHADSITGGKIINGEVASADVLDGSLGATDLGVDSVGTAELAGGSVGTFEIGANEVLSRNIAGGEVNSVDIASDGVTGADIATGAVGGFEIATDAVSSLEIASAGVGGAEIVDDVVGANELDSVHEHRDGVFVIDETAHDGVYGIESGTVQCGPNEDLLSVTIDWGTAGGDAGHAEKMLANVPTIERDGTDSATVQGAFDGGGSDEEPGSFDAVATCMAP